MGQTLTHGIYLPDEGERNCYNGLASNWSILDGAVGTVASHTTQIAGKAPLVHTHTKSDITDFPAYGTTAGTICEGNDSRLSDARTPVAHTHTKSDVTDLLNSNFIPSANNSYDLGSSSYQWNNLYAKNYYYNGVAWGLDKDNTWTKNQIVRNGSASYVLQNTNITKGIIPSNNRNITFAAQDANGEEIGRVLTRVTPNGETYTWLAAHNLYKDGTLDPTGTEKWANLYCAINGDGYPWVGTDCDFIPNASALYNLGTSTNKWKSFNGVNPGALSLPDYAHYEPINFSQWNTSGALTNTYTPDKDGLLFVNIKDTATNSIFIYAKSIQDAKSYSVSAYGNGSQGYPGRLSTIIPVIKGVTYAAVIKAASVNDIYAVTFFPCLGNV